MPKIKQLIIQIKNNNKKVRILAPVKDSLHASILSDRINALPYMKVNERGFIQKTNYADIKCFTIPSEFSYEKLQSDLDKMSNLILISQDGKE